MVDGKLHILFSGSLKYSNIVVLNNSNFSNMAVTMWIREHKYKIRIILIKIIKISDYYTI